MMKEVLWRDWAKELKPEQDLAQSHFESSDRRKSFSFFMGFIEPKGVCGASDSQTKTRVAKENSSPVLSLSSVLQMLSCMANPFLIAYKRSRKNKWEKHRQLRRFQHKRRAKWNSLD